MARSRNSQTAFETAIVAGTNRVIVTARPGYKIIVTSCSSTAMGIGHFATIAAFGTPIWTVLRDAVLAATESESAPDRDTPIFELPPGAGLLYNYTFGVLGTLADAGVTFHHRRVL